MLVSSFSKRHTVSFPCILTVVRASSLLVSAMVMTSDLLHYTTTTHTTTGKGAQELVLSLFANAIEDRRLISTLVTAHATSICSLLVLIGQYRGGIEIEPTRYKSIFIQLCQMVVPLELMVSWIFCILFDVHTKRVFEKKSSSFSLSEYQFFDNVCIGSAEETASMQCSLVTFTYTCKYIIGALLFTELLLVSTRAYKKLIVEREGAIQLYDEEILIFKTEKQHLAQR
ncbi:hypothetical protein K450DRAFT_216803 [Umbelopsis ramanniana AG]|uniref:Uncharacterized protein n=1 Tax=Umbelopsis ramanniana AG TaxID=1314678 RepID=A0AAD5EJF4_UMBRA|nr:uncharacterized protein K450DRAFT_216803 [Umbelopsis ramanniana AG]KAI8584542.1 hypothetical protein K450DRAFT_216803 [Umbelopsis ramanniana AG]